MTGSVLLATVWRGSSDLISNLISGWALLACARCEVVQTPHVRLGNHSLYFFAAFDSTFSPESRQRAASNADACADEKDDERQADLNEWYDGKPSGVETEPHVLCGAAACGKCAFRSFLLAAACNSALTLDCPVFHRHQRSKR